MIPPLDLTGMLGPERSALLELLDALDEDEWRAPTECPEWTVKGVALHVLGDDLSLLSRQRDEALQGLILYSETRPGLSFRQLLDGFNEQWVEAALFLSPPLVIELLRLAGEWTAAFYMEVDPHRPGEPVGFFGAQGTASDSTTSPTSPYWQAIAREYVERWVHQHQIRRALARADLGRGFLEPAAATVGRSFAAHLPDFDAALGTVVQPAVDDVGTWSLTRSAEGWSFADGADSDAAVVLSLSQADATPVLSRAWTADEAVAAFRISGDLALAERVLEVVGLIVGSNQ
jgi:uncharacterized protein (TIGR03083 family)